MGLGAFQLMHPSRDATSPHRMPFVSLGPLRRVRVRVFFGSVLEDGAVAHSGLTSPISLCCCPNGGPPLIPECSAVSPERC